MIHRKSPTRFTAGVLFGALAAAGAGCASDLEEAYEDRAAAHEEAAERYEEMADEADELDDDVDEEDLDDDLDEDVDDDPWVADPWDVD